MISVDEALSACLALVRPLPTEPVALARAAGRILPQAVVAGRMQPPFDAAAMDGYALPVAPVAGASFTVVGEAGAGHAWPGTLGPGQALRILTGAPVPQGAAWVVIQEDVTREGDRITLGPRLDSGTNIRPTGQDFRPGDCLGPRRLRPNDLALLAAMNLPTVDVTRRPVVALIPTGDELVMPGEAPRADQIIVSNLFAIAALCEEAGAELRRLPIARDTDASLREVLHLAQGADLILTTGGASVGDHDLVAQVAADLGLTRAFWKIAMRPGKPLMAGRLGGAAMLGLPGNPVSSIVCTHLFVLPMIRKMLGHPETDLAPRPAQAVLAEPVGANGPRAHYMRAHLAPGPGLPAITACMRQDSSLVSVLAQADALLIRPVDDPPRPAGAVVDYLPL